MVIENMNKTNPDKKIPRNGISNIHTLKHDTQIVLYKRWKRGKRWEFGILCLLRKRESIM